MNLLLGTSKYLDVVKYFENDPAGALAYSELMKTKKTMCVGGVDCPITDVVVRSKTTDVYSVIISVSIESITVEVK